MQRRRQRAQERRADAQLHLGGAGAAGPAQGVARVVEVGLAAAQPLVHAHATGEVFLVGGIEQRGHGQRVATLQRCLLARRLQTLQRVGARAFEQAIAQLVEAARWQHRQQRAIHQGVERVEDGPGVELGVVIGIDQNLLDELE